MKLKLLDFRFKCNAYRIANYSFIALKFYFYVCLFFFFLLRVMSEREGFTSRGQQRLRKHIMFFLPFNFQFPTTARKVNLISRLIVFNTIPSSKTPPAPIISNVIVVLSNAAQMLYMNLNHTTTICEYLQFADENSNWLRFLKISH